MDLTNATFSDHALEQMAKRGLSESQVRQVLAEPEHTESVRPGRMVVQGLICVGQVPQEYLLRVFVDVDCSPPQVVTVYRTSKISKYRNQP